MWSKFSEEHIAQLGNTTNWVFSSEELSSNEMWSEISSKLSQITEKVPKTKLKCSKNGDIITKAPWGCNSLKRKRTQKDASWRDFVSNPTSQNLNIALQKNKDFEEHEAKKILQHENKIVGCIKTNPKFFYRYMHSKRKIKAAVSSLKEETGKLTGSAKDTANLLASFFSSTFVKEPYGPLQ